MFNFFRSGSGNALTNPCLSTTFVNLSNKNFNNRVSSILTNVFGSNPLIDIIFQESSSLPDSINGRFSHSSQSGEFTNLYVEVNGNTLPNASREYTTITFLHEAIHAYLDLSDKTHLLDHEDMALQYRGAMADALIQIYGTDKAVADALAWQGLFGTSVWQTHSNTYIYTANQIGTINMNHHSGSAGTKCN